VINSDLHDQAIQAARDFLPADTKEIEKLRFHLKQKGPEGFDSELEKAMS